VQARARAQELPWDVAGACVLLRIRHLSLLHWQEAIFFLGYFIRIVLEPRQLSFIAHWAGLL
jgi:hypothetical protein